MKQRLLIGKNFVENFKDYIAVEVQATAFDVLPTVANGQELEIDEYRVVSVER